MFVPAYTRSIRCVPNMPYGLNISDDHQHVGRKILGAAADVGVEIAGGQAFHHADDEPADHGAEDRVEPAEDHDRETP